MQEFPSLRDAVLDLDPVLIRTLAAFSIERRGEHLGTAVFQQSAGLRFAFFGPRIDQPHNVEQYPDIHVLLPGFLDPKEQIESLEETDIAGGFNALELAPHAPGNPTDSPKWVVKTHAASQAERIQWRNSIG